jgi:diguanylate cyclase (GGDEF)-like protein/PAS domain S-box-containing protein
MKARGGRGRQQVPPRPSLRRQSRPRKAEEAGSSWLSMSAVHPVAAPALRLSDLPRELEQALAEQRAAIDHAGVGIAVILQRRVVRCNQRFAQLYGYADPAEVEGLGTAALYVSVADFHALGAAAYPVMAGGRPYKGEHLQRRRDGRHFWAQLTGTLIDTADTERGSVWIVDDIDAQKSAEAALAAVREQHQLIFDNAIVGIVFLRQRRVTHCNRTFEQLFGWGPGELDGRSSREWYLSDEDWEEAGRRCYEPFVQGLAFEGEMLLCHRDGHAIPCEVRSKAIDPQRLELGSIWITMDISARKQAEQALRDAHAGLERLVQQRTEELESVVQALEQKMVEQQSAEARIQRLAYYDALTGLPNRSLLEDRCATALSSAQRHEQPLALMFLDLDHFKTVNDSLGHRVGDAVLVGLAQRLKRVVRAQDTVARLGGDEFVFVLPETDAQGAARVAGKVLAAAQEPFQAYGHELTVTPSVGIAIYPRDGEDLDTLSRAADAAMYRAKEEGRNTWRFYTAELQAQSDRSLLLSNALRRALAREQLSLVYQPQMDLTSGRITGVEALLRWQHPELGAVSPVEFIPIAESSGLILPIGNWVLEQAAQQIAAWDREGLAPLTVAVNVSSVQLRQADLPALLKRALDRAGVGTERLEVELTEGAAMRDPQGAIEVMNTLYEQGTELSMDDFGTGYSSLAYLKRFPIGKLKIDRSFVRDLSVDAGDRAIVDAIIRMASSLGMRTVAEGVETEAQLAYLRQRGCDAMQGYLLARPLSADALSAFVRQHVPQALG